MTDTETAKDWYRLVELKINAAMGINDPKAILLINKILDNDNVKRWSDWHPNALELQRLQTIKKSIDLLRNPNSGKNWLEAKEKLAAAWAGSDVPWPLIRQGLSPFMDVEKNTILTQPAISPQSGVGTNAAKKFSYEPTKSATAKAIRIKLPSDPKHIWLAIGDETGDWDYEAKTQSKRGLVLVIGRLDVWQRAFNELIDGQTVAERMRQPLQHLPSGCKKSHFHHGIDAFKLDVNSRLSPALIKELQQNLGWLAQHSELITLGFHATHSELYQNFTFGQDASQTLAKSYAILLAYMMPFLEKEDVLLLGFETRSENADTIAAVRSNFNGASNKDGRLHMDMRGFSTTFRDALLHHLNKGWPETKNWEQRFDLAPLNQLLKAPDLNRLCPLSKIPNSAWKGLADLGASILQAQLNDKLNKHFTFAETPNVHFSKLPELLS